MPAFPNFPRWALPAFLWITVALSGFLTLTHLVLALFITAGYWQLPRVSRVTVERLEKDPNSQFSDRVIVTVGEEERELQMLKGEQRELRAHETIWVLDNPHVTPLRPTHFRLTPLRVFLEFPLPFTLLSGWALMGIHRRRLRAEKVRENDPARVRVTLRDDFHLRSQRFARPSEEGPET